MKRLLTATALAFLLVAGSAQAEVRSRTVQDPEDSQPPLSGLPTTPDIRQVQASYDTAGPFSFVIDFYHPIDALDLGGNYSQYGAFDIGFACSGQESRRYVQGSHHIVGSPPFLNQFTVSGFTGTAPAIRVVSNGGTRITVSGSATQIAGQDYRCFSYRTAARTRATASNPHSLYDPSCDCWYVEGSTDYIGKGVLHSIYFAGYGPPDPLACFKARMKMGNLKQKLRRVKQRLRRAKRNHPHAKKTKRLKRKVAQAKRGVKRQEGVVEEACVK